MSDDLAAGSLALTLDITAASRADAAGIAERQSRRLAALFRAASAAPRYRALAPVSPHGAVAPLTDWPITGKRELMRDFEAAVTDPEIRLTTLREFIGVPERAGSPYLGRHWAWESSGSTGEPALYVHDAAAMAVYDALEATRRDSPRPWQRCFDPLFLGERFAFVGATGGHFASHVSVQRLRRHWPWAAGGWQCLSILQPLAALVAALNTLQPTILATYPTAAALLADEARAGRLTLRLQEVWTGGETLGAGVREFIEHAFGCALRNSYGASEFLPIAWECAAHRLHVNADWVLLEPVDAHGRAVPPGRLSHTTLLTNLANRVQPIIRFDIGDRISLEAAGPAGAAGDAGTGRCACGSALPVVQVQGRRDDTLVVRGRHGRPVALLPLALTTVLEDEAGTFDFQLLQTAADALQLVLGPQAARGARSRERCRRALADFAARQGAEGLRISTRAQRALPLGRSGKRKRIVALAQKGC
ncbi:MAG: phenylacetate--CoA ligase family protein [Betaproteobacteria bacterium]|nr:phenylacetate--CoA ligase family protein [Betaproteobacteria bacterium]